MEEKEKYGYYGYLKLDEIYPFQLYLQNVHNWKLCHTEGNELAHMIKDGNVVTVWYDEKLRKTCTNRHGMALSYGCRIFGVQGGYFQNKNIRKWGVNDVWK